MEKFELKEATISSVHSAFEKGLITSYELVKMYLDRIEAFDKKGPSLNSIIMINPKALDIARGLDEKYKDDGLVGPLHGIPVLLKDNVNTKDMATTGGSLSLEGYIPEKDAFITKKLTDAGAIIIAKVNLHEFAVWGETVSSILGHTLNPYDLTRTPGGSSGGTGAGIAANFGIIGIGTDTINSIRSPASACSLVGIRPTVGLVSRDGVIPYSMTQDCVGPIVRTVEDAVKVLDVISDYDENDPATAWSINKSKKPFVNSLKVDGLKGKRIGLLKSLLGEEEIHREVNELMEKSLEIIKEQGATIVEIEEEIDTDYLANNVSLHLYDLKTHLNAYLKTLGSSAKVHSLEDIIKSGKYHQGIEDNIKTANTLEVGTNEYNQRMIKRYELRNQIVELMAKYNLDALTYPHQKRPVVPVGEIQVERNGVIGSVTGFPSCVVPAGFTSKTDTAPIGLPVGIEFLTREWDEDKLIEISYGFEQATKYRRQPKNSL